MKETVNPLKRAIVEPARGWLGKPLPAATNQRFNQLSPQPSPASTSSVLP
jgi:hypothetical protein